MNNLNNIENSRSKMVEILNGFNKNDYIAASKNIFRVMIGEELPNLAYEIEYNSSDFVKRHSDIFKSPKSRNIFNEYIKEIRIVAQINASSLYQLEKKELIVSEELETYDVKSLLFVVVRMEAGNYRKSTLSYITRQINRTMFSPTVIIFSYEKVKDANTASIAFINRRPSKQMSHTDVVENKVSMIYDVACGTPHPAHLDIINDLHLPNLINKVDWDKRNFRGIMDKWLEALSIEKLGKDFYKRLFDWFKKANDAGSVIFPQHDKNKVLDEENNIEEPLIRLITRFMFAWFAKEKGLIPEELFIQKELFQIKDKEFFDQSIIQKHYKPILKEKYDDGNNDYYCAVLQNLFFATLNTPHQDETNKSIRRFRPANSDAHKLYSFWCYEDLISDKDRFKELMNKIPFINGGLFDCLDGNQGPVGKEYNHMLDCFTDDKKQRRQLNIPNYLFFSSDKENPGLINIFNNYKFTVEENTPLDVEVALDPELLGNVFENLLAAYNPETRKDVRKSTGSYYTPKQVVSYMVHKSISGYLTNYLNKEKLFSNINNLENKINNLLLDHEGESPFSGVQENKILVQAISELKILDPAVGSGAFPVEILRYCSIILYKTDPENNKWKDCQINNLPDDEFRQDRINEINADFNGFSDDYFRKLYLIHNTIYGVDIQPIACQIAKLRLFISLVIEQEVNLRKDNHGIQPLPNLETNFICADSLAMLPTELNHSFEEADLADKQKEIEENRRKVFSVASRKGKMDLANKDKKLRYELKDLVYKKYDLTLLKTPNMMDDRKIKKSISWSSDEIKSVIERANKISSWNLMDPNVAADWFDPEWMLGIKSGFDIVIGNPPYIRSDNLKKATRENISKNYKTTKNKWDIYIPFFERAYNLLEPAGILCFITSRGWIDSQYGEPFRTKFIKNIKALYDSSVVFNTVKIKTLITEIHKDSFSNLEIYKYEKDNFLISETVDKALITMPYTLNDAVFSNHFKAVRKLDASFSKTIGSISKCTNVYPTDNAYKKIHRVLHDLTKIKSEYKEEDYFKVINSGIIGQYDSMWGEKTIQYYDQYLQPVVKKEDIKNDIHDKYFTLAEKPKIIIKNIGELKSSSCLMGTMDVDGSYFAGISTLVLVPFNEKHFLLLLCIINSKLASFYCMEKYINSFPGRDAVGFSQDKIESIPIPNLDNNENIIKKLNQDAKNMLGTSKNDIAKHEIQMSIDESVYELYGLSKKEIAVIEGAFK